MLALRVDKSKGEVTRRELLRMGALDTAKRVEHDEEYVYFPLSKRPPRALGAITQREFSGSGRESQPSLPQGMSFEVLGSLGLLEARSDFPMKQKKMLAKAMLDFHHLDSVFEKTPVEKEFRVRSPVWLAGKKATKTIVREHGLSFAVDIAKAYFNSHLSFERQRVAQQVRSGELVLVPFAGVGPFALVIAKKAPKSSVVGIELNAQAVKLFKENIALNKSKNCKAVLGDAKKELLKFKGKASRVLTPLPWSSREYLAQCISALRPRGVLHYYFFSPDSREGLEEVKRACALQGRSCTLRDSRVVHGYSANVQQFVLDLEIS